MERELISALSDLRKTEKENRILEEKVALLRLQVQEAENKEKNLTSQLKEYEQKYEIEVSQKQKELDATLDEINRLKE